jgi:hypothetical protein
MSKNKLFSAVFCAGALALMVLTAVTSPALSAQAIADEGGGTGCGMFNGKLCKTATTTTCTGSTCTTETRYYYYSN